MIDLNFDDPKELYSVETLDDLQDVYDVYYQLLKRTDKDQSPLEWAKYQIKLGSIKSAIAYHEYVNEDYDILSQAIECYQSAIKLLDEHPTELGIAQFFLGETLCTMAQCHEHSQELLDSFDRLIRLAIAAYSMALDVLPQAKLSPKYHGKISNALGDTYRRRYEIFSVAKRDPNAADLIDALRNYKATGAGLRGNNKNVSQDNLLVSLDRIAATYIHYGRYREDNNMPQAALTTYQYAIESLQDANELDPDGPKWRRMMKISQLKYWLCQLAATLDEGVPQYEEAVEFRDIALKMSAEADEKVFAELEVKSIEMDIAARSHRKKATNNR